MNKPQARPLVPLANDLEPGLVVATYGRHCLVETPEGRRLICHPRGKKNQVVVGDQVLWQIAGDEGSIEKLLERRNLFYRQDEIRTKSFASNLDRVLILIAADPEYSESQLSRALVAAEAERITPIIALNKSDWNLFNLSIKGQYFSSHFDLKTVPLTLYGRKINSTKR
jgi:ribosome biogenesis GTPase